MLSAWTKTRSSGALPSCQLPFVKHSGLPEHFRALPSISEVVDDAGAGPLQVVGKPRRGAVRRSKTRWTGTHQPSRPLRPRLRSGMRLSKRRGPRAVRPAVGSEMHLVRGRRAQPASAGPPGRYWIHDPYRAIRLGRRRGGAEEAGGEGREGGEVRPGAGRAVEQAEGGEVGSHTLRNGVARWEPSLLAVRQTDHKDVVQLETREAIMTELALGRESGYFPHIPYPMSPGAVSGRWRYVCMQAKMDVS